ncbi:Neutrophil gelatinase-associated lipocalin [Fukomys damarensis]|uniref:Neutrophil gelatinase-associated lipocalin n=1 Tax=Fukomys damarensis TaxID=885580 RepID=A0A091E655_FUKDA|nr:Neutrophil gelatinase-associated lipocalin [Fukomys damarensis]
MVLGQLCLGLALLGALNIQAQDSISAIIPSPPLSKILLQPDLQYDQFQGKWYIIAWAQNTAWNESLSRAALYSVTYRLNSNNSYSVTSDWFSPTGCVHMSNPIVPSDQPSQFTLENITSFEGLQNFTMTVVETDYNQFSIVSFNMTLKNRVYFEMILYGRTKKLIPKVKDHYHKLAKSLDIPDCHIIFTDPLGKDHLEWWLAVSILIRSSGTKCPPRQVFSQGLPG